MKARRDDLGVAENGHCSLSLRVQRAFLRLKLCWNLTRRGVSGRALTTGWMTLTWSLIEEYEMVTG